MHEFCGSGDSISNGQAISGKTSHGDRRKFPRLMERGTDNQNCRRGKQSAGNEQRSTRSESAVDGGYGLSAPDCAVDGVVRLISVYYLGVVFVLVYLWRKSLVVPMVMHLLIDFASIGLAALLGAKS
jgi:hypothetical protein